MKFSKTTLNFATKRDVEICECFGNEVHLIANPDENESASIAYVVQKNGSLVLAMHWDESVKNVPSVIEDEAQFRKVVTLVSKSAYAQS